jgi:hypothetical protein
MLCGDLVVADSAIQSMCCLQESGRQHQMDTTALLYAATVLARTCHVKRQLGLLAAA